MTLWWIKQVNSIGSTRLCILLMLAHWIHPEAHTQMHRTLKHISLSLKDCISHKCYREGKMYIRDRTWGTSHGDFDWWKLSLLSEPMPSPWTAQRGLKTEQDWAMPSVGDGYDTWKQPWKGENWAGVPEKFLNEIHYQHKHQNNIELNLRVMMKTWLS